MPKPLHGRCPFRHRTRTLPTVVSTRSDEPMGSAVPEPLTAEPLNSAAPAVPVTSTSPATPAARVTSARVKWSLAALAAAGCVYVAVVDPNTSSLYPQCPFRALTGYDCPGCGITRALHSALHGELLQAANHNLLMVLAAFISVVWIAFGAVQRRRGKEPPRLALPPRVIGAIGVVVVAFWVLRNLPMQPFHWLNSAA